MKIQIAVLKMNSLTNHNRDFSTNTWYTLNSPVTPLKTNVKEVSMQKILLYPLSKQPHYCSSI